MADNFMKINPDEITDNVFELVGEDWMLVTAGTPDDHNTMTASWGGFGVLWNRDICWCVIRPVRHTYQFIEKADTFTLCFFEEKYRNALNFCGTKSGRDVNKAKEAGLTPTAGSLSGTTYFEEARLVIECKKIYFQDIDPKHFLDPAIDQNYPQKDYHRMYVGEIVNVMVKR